MEDTRLLDYGNYPQIDADSIGDLQFLPFKTRVVLFAWQKVDGVFRKVIVGAVSRPKQAFTPEQIIGLQSGIVMPCWPPEPTAMRLH